MLIDTGLAPACKDPAGPMTDPGDRVWNHRGRGFGVPSKLYKAGINLYNAVFVEGGKSYVTHC